VAIALTLAGCGAVERASEPSYQPTLYTRALDQIIGPAECAQAKKVRAAGLVNALARASDDPAAVQATAEPHLALIDRLEQQERSRIEAAHAQTGLIIAMAPYLAKLDPEIAAAGDPLSMLRAAAREGMEVGLGLVALSATVAAVPCE